MAMFMAKFRSTFWPCLSRNPTFSSVVASHCSELFARPFAWTLPFLIWIQEGFTAEPPRNDSGARLQWNDSDSGPKVGVADQKSEIQPYRPTESEPNRPEKGPRMGFRTLGASTENPLKALLNPPKPFQVFFGSWVSEFCPWSPVL